jgi:hypothetical protein
MMTQPNDPTPAGAPVPNVAGNSVYLSMTELETLAGKAARGSGLDWGVAEEAGVATRWLQSHGFNGADLLLSHLARNADTHWQDVAPVINGRTWRSANAHALCPIATGTTLCDFASLQDGLVSGPIELSQVDCPAFLLPFLSGISHRLARPCAMNLSGVSVIIAKDTIQSQSLVDEDALSTCLDIQITLLDATPKAFVSAPEIRRIKIATLRDLNTFAMLTTVPATEQSRQGAGGDISDNN